MKKFLCSLLLVVMLVSSAMAVACSGKISYFELELSSDNVTVVANFETTLVTNYTGKNSIVWSVEDQSIATVENGVIYGVSEGRTTVSASVDGSSASCVVDVTAFDVSKLKLVPSKNKLEVAKGASSSLTCELYYGTKKLDVGQVSYSALSDIITVNGNSFTANTVGTTSISLSTQFKGYPVSASVVVEVVNQYDVIIDQTNVSIYPLSTFDGEDYTNTATVSAKVTDNGQNVDNAQIQWSIENTNVATISGNVVTAKTVGKTILTATYTADGETVTDSIYVEVLPITVQTTFTNNEVDKTVPYQLETSELWKTDDREITGVTVTNNVFDEQIPFSGSQLDFSESTFTGENKLIIKTSTLYYYADLFVWTKCIENVEDLSLIKEKDGYYKLTQNLDMSGVAWEYSESFIFTGYFDGNGKTISNFNLYSDGLFNEMGDGATVKNLTFANAVISNDATELGVLAKSVKDKCSVTIDNVKAEVIVGGNGNGGLIGLAKVNSKVTLKNVNVYAYSDGNGGERGAIFAGSAGSVTLDGVNKVYSSMEACSKYISTSNTNSSAINQLLSTVKPTAFDSSDNEMLNAVAAEDQEFTFNDVSNVVQVVVYGSEKRVIDEASNTITVVAADYESIDVGAVDVLFKLSDGSYKYYTLGVYSELHITNSNVNMLTQISKGRIYLDEDITISSAWATANKFSGTFDGQGYTISGLTFKEAGIGLFKSMSGTFKNTAFVGVSLGQGNTAPIAQSVTGDLVVENVFVKVSSVLANGYQGGLVERNTNADYKLTVKNVYVELGNVTKSTDRYVGFVSGFMNKNVSVENGCFVGGHGYLYTGAEASATASNYKVFDNYLNVAKAIDANTFSFNNEFLSTQFAKHCKVLMLTKENFSDLKDSTKMTGVGFVLLKEDITFTTREVWTSNVTFSGTFDGQGHSISGLEMYSSSGLFKIIENAIIKNVAIVNVKLNGGNTATIAYTAKGTNKYDNVFVQVSEMTTGDAWRGGLIERGGAAGNHLTNVVILFEVDTNPVHCGYVAGHNGGTMSLTNCYLIGSADREIRPTNTSAKPGGSVTTTSTYTKITKADFITAKTGGTLAYTYGDQMTAWINQYVK